MPQTSYEYKESMIRRIEDEIEELEDDLKGMTADNVKKSEIAEVEKELKEAEEDLERIEKTPAEQLLRERYS
jgi:Mg2+ and Co2+ transporter CorA